MPVTEGHPAQEQDTHIRFSFLTPTRNRPDLVARLFDSIVATTSRLDQLEVILAVDHDDTAGLNISDERLNVKKVILQERLTMGALNNACFDASSGRYVMIMNDDVILRTRGWDRIVADILAGCGDDIGLVHVNDLLFQEKLCTFPILSRRACLEIGLCPNEYRRYKIDDDIYDIYQLLAYLGHKRITYLPDVIFEHENHEAAAGDNNRHTFSAAKGKVYVPRQGIIERDHQTYLDRLDGRKAAALKLATLITEEAERKQHNKAETVQRNRLNAVTTDNPYAYRHGSFVKTVSGTRSRSATNARTTVAVVTADLRGECAQRCLASVKENTSNYDLVILDNNRGEDFSHPREMNKVLDTARTDCVVLLDDDVFVEPGWLEGMLACLDDETAAVTPMHKDADGNLTYSGMYLAGGGRGTHDHTLDTPDRPRSTQVHCSAALLIDMRKCGFLRMDETYRKYFFDLAHALEVWEAGYRTVCTPRVTVTHLGGATTVRGSDTSDFLWAHDRNLFISNWVRSGRLDALAAGIWQREPYVKFLADTPARICRLLDDSHVAALREFKAELAALVAASRGYALFGRLMEVKLVNLLLRQAQNTDEAKFSLCLNCLTLLKKSSGRVREMMELNAALVDKNRVDLAASVARAALTLSPRDADVWKRFGGNQYLLGDVAASRKAYERVLDLNGRDMIALISLAKIAMQEEEYEEAFEHFHAAAREDANHAEAHVGLAVVARHLHNKPVFKAAYRRARQLAPDHPAVRDLGRQGVPAGVT